MNKHLSFILGGWSPNIGNAFFQLAGLDVLKTVLPDAAFSIISEQPGYPSYWNPKGGNPKNFFDMASAVHSDYLVLMGPMFRPETMKIWGDSLQKIMNYGTKLVLLGVAAMKYGQNEINSYRSFLRKYPPYLMTTRDTDTYELLGDRAQYAYNGIDLAFFVPDYYPVSGLRDYQPYVAICFDKVPEPDIFIVAKDSSNNLILSKDKTFQFREDLWCVRSSNWKTKFARKSRYLMFLEGLLFSGVQSRQIGQYQIIRTDHRYNPIIARKTFRSPNVMVIDTPYPYFEIYGNSDLTISNRLHACVIALAYGKPAMLFSESPRVRLISRLNLDDIVNHPVILDIEVLKKEKEGLLAFLKSHL